MCRNKSFRSVLCVLLAILTLIHTTPLYASGSQSAGSESESAAVESDSARTSTASAVAQSAGTGEEPSATIGDLVLSPQAPAPNLSTGAATYSIPIEVPKGRGNIAPNLALTYNSYLGNGWVGVGWNLDMGYIQRSTKKGLSYTANQFIASVQGSVSELTARPAWGEGHYENKIEGGFLNYYLNNSTGGWEVTDKSGIKYYYGSTTASRQGPPETYRWLLDRVQDLNGNYMIVSYQGSYGELYLSQIRYAGNVSGPPTTNSVIFDIESRPDVLTSLSSGIEVRTVSRLQAIRVFGNNQLARTYRLSYLTSPRSSRSLLQSITQFGSDDTTAMEPITFEWQTGSNGFGAAEYMGERTLGTTVVFSQIVDVNADGLADFVFDHSSDDTPATIHIKRNAGGSYPDENMWGARTSPYDSKFKGFYLADLIGDSYPDLIYHDSSGRIHVLMNTGGARLADDDETAIMGVRASGTTMNSPFKIADVNRDGVPDLIYEGDRGRIHVLTGNTSNGVFAGFSTDEIWGIRSVVSILGVPSGEIKLADVNGDGMADVVYDGTDGQIHVSPSAGTWFRADTPWLTSSTRVRDNPTRILYMADVNGDGLADAIYIANNPETGIQEFRVALSTGTGFLPDRGWGTFGGINPGLSNYNNPIVTDVNSDSLPDLVYNNALNDGQLSGYGYIQVFLNTGASFSYAGIWGTYRGDSYEGFSMADTNGDGIPDFTLEKNIQDANPRTFTFRGNGPAPDLIRKIDNGIGGTYTIGYTPSTAYGKVLPFVLRTVSSVTSDDGNGNLAETDYTYANALFSYSEREFRGFNYVKQTLPNGTTVESYFYQDDVKKGLMYDQKVNDVDGTLFQEQVNTYEVRVPYANTSFPCLVRTDTYLYDGSATPGQVTTTFNYDAYGNVISKFQQGDPESQGDERYDIIEYSYDTANWLLALPSFLCTRETNTPSDDNDLSRTAITYYANKGLVRTKTFWLKEKGAGEVDPAITYVYDDYGNLVSLSDPNGNPPTITEYDPTMTFPETVTNPKGHSVTVTYDYRYGKPLARTDFNGYVTHYYYDALGRVTTVVGPNDSITHPTRTYSYNDLGTTHQNIGATVLEQTGTTQIYWKTIFFDGFGRQTSVHSEGPGANPIYVDTIYDSNGKVWKKSYPYLGNVETPRWVVYTYDNFGRLHATNKPDGGTAYNFYSQYRTTYLDPMSKKRIEDRDAYGRVIRVYEYYTSTNFALTTYAYDPLGKLVQVTDANNNVTTINFDTLGRKINMQDPDMGYWEYRYDANGNLTAQTDAKLDTVTFEYDEINRPTLKHYPTGTDVSYAYDDDPTYGNAVGRLTSVTDASGTTVMHYDNEGRVTFIRKIVGGVSYYIRNTYDALGRITGIRYPDNEWVNYTYDTAGNISGVTGYATFLNYNALGQPGEIHFGNNVVSAFSYYDETDSRLRDISTGLPGQDSLQHYSYVYDLSGNLTSISDHIDSNRNQTFTYDLLNRLTRAESPSYTPIDFTYSKTGNILTNSRVGTYSYNPLPHPRAVKTAGSNTYTYDANGNMITRNGSTIAYDYDNRPSSITTGSVTTSFVYDYKGARVKKTTDSPQSTTVYIGNLYECKDGVCTKHIFAGGRRIASKSGTNTWYYHSDHLGGLNVVTDSSGTPVQNAAYYPFGETRSSSGSINLPYKFTGQENDPESGLYYYGARYYDPVIGRFISPDSIVQAPGDPQTLNRYAYCRNNPLIYTDPTGHIFGIDDFICAIIIGALLNVTIAAIQGTDLSTAAALGAFSGAMFYGAGQIAGAVAKGLSSSTMASLAGVGIHVAAGMGTGALSAAAYHQDVSTSAIVGGLSAGAAKGAGMLMEGSEWYQGIGRDFGKSGQFAVDLPFHAAIGAVSGGIAAQISGGNFGSGAAQGAWTAAYGYLFNKIMHKGTDRFDDDGDSPTARPKQNPLDINSSVIGPNDHRLITWPYLVAGAMFIIQIQEDGSNVWGLAVPSDKGLIVLPTSGQFSRGYLYER